MERGSYRGDRARGDGRGRGGGGRCYGGGGGRGYGGGGDRGRGDGAGGGRGYRGGGDRGRGSERGDGNRGFGFDVSAARCYRHTLKPTAQGLSLCLDYSVLLMEPKDHLDTESALCLKKLSLVSPKQRKENIDKLINSKDGPSGGDIIGNFGLKVEKEMTEMSGSEIMTSPQDASSSEKSQPINEGSEFVDRVDLLVNRLENPFEVSELDGEGRFGKGDTEEAISLLQAFKLSEKEAHSSSQGDSVSKDETLKSAEKLPYVLSNKKESKTVLDFTAEEDFDNGGQGDLQAALRP